MKKLFEKLTAVTLVVGLLSVGATVEKAEAATCSKHGSYYETVVAVRDKGYMHSVEKDVYVLDEEGWMINLSELTGQHYYINCTVAFQERNIHVRCERCYLKIYDYWYTTPERHSVCAVG